MLKEIKLANFRIFSNKNLVLGKYLTVLAGGNATGKSTILGMLGNCGELKKKDGATYLGKSFRAEFNEIFQGSEKFDISGSDKFEVTMCDETLNQTDYRKFRITWQSKGEINEKRFRVIPYHDVSGKTHHDKFNLPVIYLGLSRLYPIGESHIKKNKDSNVSFKSQEHENWYIEQYEKILSINDPIVSISNCSIEETDKKTCIGINTDKYDYLCNSSGQDNLGQILLALLSFKNLKESLGDAWSGGLLLIDEIDAALHPSAQEKLSDLLYKEAKELGIQVVFTTHSLSLLKHISTKTERNNSCGNNNIELCYFSNANGGLNIHCNISYQAIENDLLIKTSNQKIKIKVYAEDDEARWFSKKILFEYRDYIEFVPSKLGCKELIKLMNCDVGYFGNVLILFDGDVSDRDLKEINSKHMKNYMKLPGNKVNPEILFYNYLTSLSDEHRYWNENTFQRGLTLRNFRENGPDNRTIYQGKNRDRQKSWFKDYLQNFEATGLYEAWEKDNVSIVKAFKSDFVNIHNNIAKRLCLPIIML